MRPVFKARRTFDSLKAAVFAAAAVILVVLVYFGLENISRTQAEKQLELAEDAIVKAAVQCYALESQYPPSLQYLVDNYGVTLDEHKYIYHYRAIGSNMVPEIRVFPNTTHVGGGGGR